MQNVSQDFLTALENSEIQHIGGTLKLLTGETINLTDEVLIGTPSCSRQCTSVADEFGRGAPRWQFRAEDSTKRKFTIAERSKRQHAEGNIVLKILRREIGVKRTALVAKVTELTGVEFAQTPEEIAELIGFVDLFGATYCKTVREEVAAIAQLLGGFACDDRDGKIIFRKFGAESGISIAPDRRHSIKLSEYTFGVRGVGYTNAIGQRAVVANNNATTADWRIIATFADNTYLDIRSEDVEDFRRIAQIMLKYTAKNLELPDWTPGELAYYGNPALDLGDFVEIVGGINGERRTKFLITAENWTFRSAQTLISAGASAEIIHGSGGSSGTSGGSGMSQSQQIVANVTVAMSMKAVVAIGCAEQLSEVVAKVAEVEFSCKSQTTILAEISLIIAADEACGAALGAYLDDVAQAEIVTETLGGGEVRTLHMSFVATVEGGAHKIEWHGAGVAEIRGISGFVYGQDIVGAVVGGYCQLYDLDKLSILTPDSERIFVVADSKNGYSTHKIEDTEAALDNLADIELRVAALEEAENGQD